MKEIKIESALDLFTSNLKLGDLIDTHNEGLRIITGIGSAEGGGVVITYRSLTRWERIKHKLRSYLRKWTTKNKQL